MPRQPLEPLEHCRVHPPCAKLVYELVVVDSKLLPVRRHRALHVPRRDDLLMGFPGGSRLDRRRRA